MFSSVRQSVVECRLSHQLHTSGISHGRRSSAGNRSTSPFKWLVTRVYEHYCTLLNKLVSDLNNRIYRVTCGTNASNVLSQITISHHRRSSEVQWVQMHPQSETSNFWA